MDTNLVLPLGANKCQVVFDYFLDASLEVFSVSYPYNDFKYKRKRKNRILTEEVKDKRMNED